MKTARALALALALILPAAAAAATVTVFAAASLREALGAVARDFEARSGHRVVVSYAGSNALARQIEAGAPAAIFVSADTDWIDYIERRGLAVAGSRRDLVRNDLVLVAPAASRSTLRIAPGFALAAALGEGRIAMANPDAVPAGRYGKAALVKLGVWAGVRARVAGAENVRAALALVSRGEAPFGIVYRSDALADKGVRIVDTFPADTHPPIVYPMVLLRAAASDAARALAADLASPAALALWTRFGFRAP